MAESTVVISNPYSRLNYRNKARVREQERIVGSKGEVITTHDLDDIMDAIAFILKYQPEVVYTDSGDGGQSVFYSLFYKQLEKAQKRDPTISAPLAAVPYAGTYNVLARHVGNKTGDDLGYLIYVVETDKEDMATQDVGLMKTSDDNGMVTYGFSFGVGMPITLLKEAYKGKYLKALRIAMVAGHLLGSSIRKGKYYKNFAEKRMYRVSNGDGEKEEVNLLGLMAQTIPGIGLPWSNMFYKAIDTGKFHVLGTEHNILEFMLLSPVLVFGKTPMLRKDFPLSNLDFKSALSFMPTLYTGNTHLLSRERLIDKQREHYEVECLEDKAGDGEMEYTVNGDLDFMKKKFKARKVTLEHGRRMSIVKFLG